MDATIIIAIVPVVLLVAYIIWLVRAKITEGREIDLREPITALVICLVAVLIIGSMTASTVTYTYSEDTNTLYINQNLIDSRQPFDSYGDEVKSVVIGNNCRLVETGTLDSLTSLEYVKIESGVDVRPGAFGVSFEDPYGQTISVSNIAGSEYAGFGDGVLFQCDQSIFALSGTTITGLSTEGASAKFVVIPESIEAIRSLSETGIEAVLECPRTTALTVSSGAFGRCASLAEVSLPSLEEIAASVFQYTAIETASFPNAVRIGDYAFQHCESLAAIDLPIATYIGQSAFQYTALTEASFPEVQTVMNTAFKECASLASVTLPKTTSISNYAFQSCASMTAVSLPALTTLGNSVFITCTGIASVTFGPLESLGSASPFPNWTFYASDGSTQLDKTVASNLAGKTFMGTASALVEVAPGQLNLTPQQLQQVQLHTQELQTQDLDIQPLPFQPTVQTQDQEPAAA